AFKGPGEKARAVRGNLPGDRAVLDGLSGAAGQHCDRHAPCWEQEFARCLHQKYPGSAKVDDYRNPPCQWFSRKLLSKLTLCTSSGFLQTAQTRSVRRSAPQG